MFLASNHKPQISGVDDAIWNRIMVLPFNFQIPKKDQEKNFERKLMNECSGILAWAVKGCLEWQKMGLKVPDQISNAIKDYRAETDVYEAFIQDCFLRPESKFAENSFATSSDLLEEWKNWCNKSAINADTPDLFFKTLANKCYERGRKIIDGEQRRVFKGIMLKSKARRDLEKAHKDSIDRIDE